MRAWWTNRCYGMRWWRRARSRRARMPIRLAVQCALVRPRRATELAFLGLGPVAERYVRAAAATGCGSSMNWPSASRWSRPGFDRRCCWSAHTKPFCARAHRCRTGPDHAPQWFLVSPSRGAAEQVHGLGEGGPCTQHRPRQAICGRDAAGMFCIATVDKANQRTRVRKDHLRRRVRRFRSRSAKPSPV